MHMEVSKMAERHTSNTEHGGEAQKDPELEKRSQEIQEAVREKAEKATHAHREKIDELRQEIDAHAKDAESQQAETTGDKEPDQAQTYWYSAEYRQHAYDQLIKKVRGRLPKSQRLASKILHQPTVERLSDIGSRTVARPSGVLFGSICSFIGSFIAYFFAKRYGYDMTYSVFIASFLGGFLAGIIIEALYKGFRALLARN